MRKGGVLAGVVVVGVVLVVVARVRAGGSSPQEGVAEGVPFGDLVGKYVRVEFRGASEPVERRSTSTTMGGVRRVNEVAIGAEGTLREVRAGWIRLSQGPDQECWVPLEAVAVIENAMSAQERMEIQRKVEEGRER